jgi:hypothetical protein
MKRVKESIFMQMHNGTRSGEGSFNVALRDLFYKADQQNRRKLVGAFPEFFGKEVPEFGIVDIRQASITQVCVGDGNIQIAGVVTREKYIV